MAKQSNLEKLKIPLIILAAVIYGFILWSAWDSGDPINSLATIGTVIGFSLIGGLVIAYVAFWICMFLDIFWNKKLSKTEKIAWGLGFIFISGPVSILYYFVAYSKRKH